MKKILLQFTILASTFFLSWFLLSRIDYVNFFGIEQLTKSNERKIGNIIIDAIKDSEKEITSDSVRHSVRQIMARICKANKIEVDSIKIHIIYNSEINAFALPDRNMVIYSGLIVNSKNAEEVAGVMAHELAHIEQNHVTKKLVKEVGISVLASIASGNGNPQIFAKLGKLISSTAYDRTLESEADRYAVEYLSKASIDPNNLANFLFNLADKSANLPSQMDWISTHPDSKERALEITKLTKKQKFVAKPIATEIEWQALKGKVAESAF